MAVSKPDGLESNVTEQSEEDRGRLVSDHRAAENESSREEIHDVADHVQSSEHAQANGDVENADPPESEVSSWPDELPGWVKALTRGDMILTRPSNESTTPPRLLLICGVTTQPNAAATTISESQEQAATISARMTDAPATQAYTRHLSEMLVVEVTSQAHKQAAERLKDAMLPPPISAEYRCNTINDILQELEHLARPLSNVDMDGHYVFWRPAAFAICKLLSGDTCANQYCRDGYAPRITSVPELENGPSAAPRSDVDWLRLNDPPKMLCPSCHGIVCASTNEEWSSLNPDPEWTYPELIDVILQLIAMLNRLDPVRLQLGYSRHAGVDYLRGTVHADANGDDVYPVYQQPPKRLTGEEVIRYLGLRVGAFLTPKYCIDFETGFNLRDTSCVMCLDDYERGDYIVETKCKHQFHAQCLEKWFDQSNTCPMCRTVHEVEMDFEEDTEESDGGYDTDDEGLDQYYAPSY